MSFGRDSMAAWIVVKSARLSEAETLIVPFGQ